VLENLRDETRREKKEGKRKKKKKSKSKCGKRKKLIDDFRPEALPFASIRLSVGVSQSGEREAGGTNRVLLLATYMYGMKI
jgi:hypothetical protein